MSTLDNAKDNRVAVLVCILLIYILYHFAFIPHLIWQSDVYRFLFLFCLRGSEKSKIKIENTSNEVICNRCNP
jgi:amino acid transporter